MFVASDYYLQYPHTALDGTKYLPVHSGTNVTLVVGSGVAVNDR